MRKKYDVFVSYRRIGGFESASLIAEKLRSMGYSVFFDVESLRSGKFNEQLYKVIEQCKDFVIVLPEQALNRCSNEDGTANEEDWIRKEVLFAMTHQKNIIPVMLAGFVWPKKMPVGLENLSDYQSITASNYDTFDLAMMRLAGYLYSKRHRFKLLKVLSVILASLVALTALTYLLLLQIARPVCTSVANEYSVGMGIVYELRNDEENIKTEWETFLASYNTASTQIRKSNLESDLLSFLEHSKKESEKLRGQIRPIITLSNWQTMLLGLYDSQQEDVQSLPTFVESFIVDLDSLTNVIKRVIGTHSYKPSEIRNVNQNFQLYELSVNLMYYSYLQEITKLPKGSRKTHAELSKLWNLLPTTAMTLPQEEYERLAMAEATKMQELLHKMESYIALQENDTYELGQRIDTLETMAEYFGMHHEKTNDDDTKEKLNIVQERVAMKHELIEQKKTELSEGTRKLQQIYEELKNNCRIKSTDSESYQWGKIIRMARMLSKSVDGQKEALRQGIQSGAVIKPLMVYSDICTMLDDYQYFHPQSKSFIAPLRLYYKMVADGKRTLGGQLIFAFKDNAKHPLYEIGDIIVKRNDTNISDNASLASAVSNNKRGTVEFLRIEDSKLVLHKENVPESQVLVGYMEVGEY